MRQVLTVVQSAIAKDIVVVAVCGERCGCVGSMRLASARQEAHCGLYSWGDDACCATRNSGANV